MKAYRGEKKSPHELFAVEALKPESEIDLGRAALLIANSEYPSLDVEFYLQRLDQMAEVIAKPSRAQDALNSQELIERINKHLFQELSFRGNLDNYYDPKNSFLNEVLDRRLGIPITLSVIYLEVARRLGLNVEGIGMPGHFLILCRIDEETILLDPFNGGRRLTEADCEQMIVNIYGEGAQWQPAFLRPVSKREILTRMLTNLKNIYISGGDNARALTIVDRLLILKPDAISERKDRGLINFRLNRFSAALKDLEEYLLHASEGPEAESVRQYLVRIKSRLASLN